MNYGVKILEEEELNEPSKYESELKVWGASFLETLGGEELEC